MAVLIDTDVLVDLERDTGNRALEAALGEQDRAVSVITVSELLHGVHRAEGSRRAQRSAFVEHLLAGLPAIPITAPIARVHAVIWADMAGAGQPIGGHDLWIAATALAHGFALATGNRADFERVPGLELIATA